MEVLYWKQWPSFVCCPTFQTEKYWSNVLGDLLKIAELCFPSLSIEICCEEYVKMLLGSQNQKNNTIRLCLQIMPNAEDLLLHEWNLISAMTVFNTLGTKLLPVQGNYWRMKIPNK